MLQIKLKFDKTKYYNQTSLQLHGSFIPKLRTETLPLDSIGNKGPNHPPPLQQIALAPLAPWHNFITSIIDLGLRHF